MLVLIESQLNSLFRVFVEKSLYLFTVKTLKTLLINVCSS